MRIIKLELFVPDEGTVRNQTLLQGLAINVDGFHPTTTCDLSRCPNCLSHR